MLHGLCTSCLIRQSEQGRLAECAVEIYFARRLAQRLKDAYTPIIALTVYAMVGDLQECIAVGMVDNFTNLILPENLQRS